MGKLNCYEALTPVRRMMTITATWPKKNPSVLYKIRTVFSLTLLAAIAIVSIIQDYNNIEISLYGFCAGFVALQLFIKHVILFSNKSRFFELLALLRHPAFISHEDHLDIYLKKRIRICNILRIMLLCCAYTTLTFILVKPVATQEDRRLIVATILDLTQVSSCTYMSFWMFQFLGAVLNNWQMSCFNSLMYNFLAIATAQLEILQERLRHSTDINYLGRFEANEKYDRVVQNKLRICIAQHITIARFINIIESTFTYAFLVQMLVSLMICCFLCLVCVVMKTGIANFAGALFFFLAVMLELAVFCLLGNQITVQSSAIRDACYDSQWNNCGPLVRKTLFLIMERSKRPLALTAGGFVTLSHETLISVLQSAFSYFTVIWNLYSSSHGSK